MSSQTTTVQLAEAVLDFVKDGRFPDSEDIISAELTPPSFNATIDLIVKAREDVKVCYYSAKQRELH